MKKIIFSLFLIMIFFFTPALAAPVLHLPEQIKVILINGTRPANTQKIELNNKLNQLVFRFEGELGHSFDDKERVYSDVFVVLFSAEGKTLKLSIPKIRNEIQLEKFNQHPDINIVSQTNNDIPYAIDKLEKDGFQVFRDYRQELKDFNQGSSSAALHLDTKEDPAGHQGIFKDIENSENQRQITSDNETETAPTLAEEMLKYWYQQADKKTKERFKKWISE
ncbi:MAG: DUF2057 domain-containing protein [Pelovirga sp.]